jgi:hypothetical protein
MHDYDLSRYTVHDAVVHALASGHFAYVLPISCSLVLLCRAVERFYYAATLIDCIVQRYRSERN